MRFDGNNDHIAELAEEMERRLQKEFDTPNDAICFLLYFVAGVLSHLAKPGRFSKLTSAFLESMNGTFEARREFDLQRRQ